MAMTGRRMSGSEGDDLSNISAERAMGSIIGDLERKMMQRFEAVENVLHRLEAALSVPPDARPVSTAHSKVASEAGKYHTKEALANVHETRAHVGKTHSSDPVGPLLSSATEADSIVALAKYEAAPRSAADGQDPATGGEEATQQALSFRQAAVKIQRAIARTRSDARKESWFKLRVNWMDWQKQNSEEDQTMMAMPSQTPELHKKCARFREAGHEEEKRSQKQREEREQLKRSPCILGPSCKTRLAWDLMSMALIFYDMLMIPLQLAFDPKDHPITDVMGMLTLYFWTCDIPLSFFTGYYSNGMLIGDRRRIAVHYITGWLPLDVVVVGVDWASLTLKDLEALSLLRSVKTIRILRILRSLRLLRLAKLRKVMEEVQDRIHSDAINIGITVLQYIFIIVLINHMIACSWFALGKSKPTDVDTWVHGPKQHFRDDRDTLAYHYLTSLHWSLTQFTPASMEVTPENVHERLFAVLVLVFALIVFSSFLSSITSAMTQLRNLHGTIDRNMSVLRRFLRSRRVPPDLYSRIVRYVEHQMAERKQEIQEHDVATLKLLSRPLHMELVQATYSPILTKHPFFHFYEVADPEAMKQLCVSAVSCWSLSAGDIVFTEGAKSEDMIFVLKGKLRYFVTKQPDRVNQENSVCSTEEVAGMSGVFSCAVEQGEWCCEASLWTNWRHIGTALAVKNSEVLRLSAATFGKVTREHIGVAAGSYAYGVSFVAELNSKDSSQVRDVIHQDRTQLKEMVGQAFPDIAGIVSAESHSRRNSFTAYAGSLGMTISGLAPTASKRPSSGSSGYSNEGGSYVSLCPPRLFAALGGRAKPHADADAAEAPPVDEVGDEGVGDAFEMPTGIVVEPGSTSNLASLPGGPVVVEPGSTSNLASL